MVGGADKKFYFKSDSMEARNKWVDYLRNHISVSTGYSQNLTACSKLDNFWRRSMIGPREFVNRVDSGDVLLFQSKNFAAGLQRAFTNSNYDHAAMLLKYDDGEVVLFEATGNSGVSLCRWSFFMSKNWHLLYPKMVYRRLECTRDAQFYKKLTAFVEVRCR